MDKNLRLLIQSDILDGIADNIESNLRRNLTRQLFSSIADGDMDGIRHCLQATRIKLTELTESKTGKTCLMKALLNLNANTMMIVEELIAVAERDDYLQQLINAEYCDKDYNGQTALHIAIERRCPDIVQILLEKGANVNAKANGKFFRSSREHNGFYFGELPLALAACTNQPQIVTLLLDNPRTNVGEQDSWGNTVLHALVSIADDNEDNTMFVTEMYNTILLENKEKNLEEITNAKGLTPLQLAAKLGKLEIFRNILNREMYDKQHMELSRKITDWAYGPVSSSLYDITEVDTFAKNSVLKVIAFNTKIQNRHLLLAVEPLNTLLEQKWDRFAVYMFTGSCLLYVSYVIIFTAIYYDTSQANTNTTTTTPWYLGGQILVFSWAVVLFILELAVIAQLRLSYLQSIMTDAWFHILFILQAGLAALGIILNWTGVDPHLAVEVGAMALGWINILYYTRGFQSMGIYSVMLQKILLTDVTQFLTVYSLFLIGFAAALASLIQGCSNNEECSSFESFNTATLELFKLTIGLGDLEVQRQAKHPQLFLFLLVLYVILTFILLLNMLIALMGETVENISKESKIIWKLQRARTILNLEKYLPKCLKEKFRLGKELNGKRYIRINEVNWTKWNTTLARIHEDPGEEQEGMVPENPDEMHNMWLPSRKKSHRSKRTHRTPINIWSRRISNFGFSAKPHRKSRQADVQSEMVMVSEQGTPSTLGTADCNEAGGEVKRSGDSMI
ncbi:transient receptor potential cation channel subfamily V member 3-like [Scyliorhinus canicula]|uniref:transient receptor potential cation channel subfamily V member 3-like n=1 Tax=Scyliorhinus canicula TaxID=7830 RepID=UPI0018F47A05|nr:transient receptor potential cation channel subfamily V member 3-like [Scyliorhinus canicula]